MIQLGLSRNRRKLLASVNMGIRLEHLFPLLCQADRSARLHEPQIQLHLRSSGFRHPHFHSSRYSLVLLHVLPRESIHDRTLAFVPRHLHRDPAYLPPLSRKN